jgi:signal peptidase I
MIQTLNPEPLNARFSLADILPAASLPHVGHLFCLKVTSWSMFPTILKGDVLTIEPADQVLPGDIVVFQHIGTLVCHRVTSVGAGGEIYTKGDQADRPDPPIPQRDILAKVTAIMRGGQNVSPAPLRDPPIASLVRMKADLFLTAAREHLRSRALKTVALFKHVPWVRDAVAVALRKRVRFSVGIRAPIRALEAYRFIPLGKWHGGHGDGFPPECHAANALVFMAHLGGQPLATFDPASGKVSIRRIAAGLGLEESLRNWNHRLQSARASTRS